MPHHKSCKKRLITNKRRNERNRQNKATLRSAIKEFRATVGQAPAEDKAASLSKLYSMVDIQARKGIMPRKRAARLKSRLAGAAAE